MYRTLAKREIDDEVVLADVKRAERLHRRRVAIAGFLMLGVVVVLGVVAEHAHLARSHTRRRLLVRSVVSPKHDVDPNWIAPTVPTLRALDHRPSGLRGRSVVIKEIEPFTIQGDLEKDVIRRIVRQSFGRFRLCYENGLRENPKLEGTVSIRFLINRDGATVQAEDEGSGLPDRVAVACMARGFESLSFPSPPRGIVVVRYSLWLTPE